MSSLTLSSHATSKKRKVVNVILLDKEELQVFVDVKSKFQDVFNQVATHLNLRETEYFGLAQKKDGEFHFVTLDEKIHKQAPKVWKSGHGEGLDASGQPIYTVNFRVQFYVDQVVLLREKVTRHLYYLQLKENVLNYNHMCSEEKCFQTVSYALQADLGNYHPDKHGENYFDPREYFPAWIVEQRGTPYIQKNTPIVHKDLANLTKSEAKLRFIKEASMSPAAHNLHFYRLRKRKTDKVWNAWLGICAKGIEIYEDIDGNFKDFISTFLWPDIGKLYFDKKKFEIRSVGNPAGRKFTYYTDCDNKSKYLLYICRTTHMFQMAIQSKLMEIRHLDAEDKKRYNEAYIYSDTKDFVANGGSFSRGSLSPSSKSSTNQRYSVISDASSNTTSGIASDKMTVSFEEPDDSSREIIIDCPPRTPNRLTPPTPSRSKFPVVSRDGTAVSTLPNYMSNKNRSPVLDSRPSELYKSSSFGRPGGCKAGDRSPSVPRPLGNLQLSPTMTHTDKPSPVGMPSPGSKTPLTPLGNSIGGLGAAAVVQQTDLDYSSSHSSGSFRRRLSQQQQFVAPPPYNPQTVPVYIAHAPTSSTGHRPERISFSTPVSRSTSRADSFKSTLGQLQVHTSDSQIQQMSLESNGFSDQVMDMFTGNVNLINYHNQPALDGVMPPPIQQNQASNYMPSNQAVDTSGYIEGSEMTLQEAHELFAPPPMFADSSGMNQMLEEQSSSVSNFENSIASSSTPPELPKSAPPPLEARRYLETDLDEEIEPLSSEASPSKDSASLPKKRNGKTKNEILHPEIKEKIVGQNTISIPLMTALFNDRSLIHTNSQNGSLNGSGYDNSTIKSTDSHISRISHDFDPRRLSSCYPSGTMMAQHLNRPFSWHSESFDLDQQLSLNGIHPVAHSLMNDNHHSVPQNIGDIMGNATSSWTHAIAHSIPNRQGVLDRYSPELIATQHMIPPKISSGMGHNSSDRNMSQKPLKETIGIA